MIVDTTKRIIIGILMAFMLLLISQSVLSTPLTYSSCAASYQSAGQDCDQAFDTIKTGAGNFIYLNVAEYPFWLIADYGSDQCISQLEIINGREDAPTFGSKDCWLEYSTDNSTYINVTPAGFSMYQPANPYPSGGNYTLNITADYGGPITARYLKLRCSNNWAGDENTEITEITAISSPGDCAPVPPTPNNFSVTATDLFNSSSIDSFNITIVGHGSYSTTTGKITTNILDNDTAFYDIVVGSQSYFNQTYSNFNVSLNLSAELYQAVFNFNATEILTNNSISGGMFNLSDHLNNSGLFYVSAGTYNVTFTFEDYYPITKQFSILPLQNLSETISGVYNALVNVSAFDNYTTEPISGFFASAYGIEYNTTKQSLLIPSLIGNSTNISVWGTTYIQKSLFHNFSANYTYLNFSLWQTGAIKIYFYYEENGSAIDSVDINVVALNGTANINNNTGASTSFYTTTTDIGEFKITIDKAGFSEKIYYETLLSGDYIEFNAYLLPDDDTQATNFQVYNQINQLVADAQLTFYKLINGILERVAMAKTDFSGAVQVNLNSNSLYILRATHDDYLQKEVSLVPTATTYKVYLTGTNLEYTSIWEGVEYSTSPSGIRNLDGNTSTIFSLSVSAANNNLDYWGVKLTFINDSGGIETYLNNQTISTGGFANITITTPTNKTTINATYFIKISGEEIWEKNILFYVYPSASGSNIALSSFEEYGAELDDLLKTMFATFITLGIVGATSYLTFNGYLIAIEILVVFGFFAFVNWIPLWIYLLTAVPTIIITFLTGGGEN